MWYVLFGVAALEARNSHEMGSHKVGDGAYPWLVDCSGGVFAKAARKAQGAQDASGTRQSSAAWRSSAASRSSTINPAGDHAGWGTASARLCRFPADNR